MYFNMKIVELSLSLLFFSQFFSLTDKRLNIWKGENDTKWKAHWLECISIRCRETNSKWSPQSNRKKKLPQGALENAKEKQKKMPDARETRVTQVRLVLVLRLIGREVGASFLDQSQNVWNVISTVYLAKIILEQIRTNQTSRVLVIVFRYKKINK